MPDGHDIFDEKSIYTTTGYTDIYTDTLDIKYQKQGKDSKYTNLKTKGHGWRKRIYKCL